MKFIVALFIYVILSSANSAQIPGDNSRYVEGRSRYIWMSDGEGFPQLVDLQRCVDQTALLRAINGTNNQYWLYTRSNPKTAQVLLYQNVKTISGSNYNANLPTKVIVHGWNNNGFSSMNPLITSAFLAVGDFNVIVVDWNRLANEDYNTASTGVPDVGIYLGKFLFWLFNTAGGNWNHLHLVGFSLGAHVVGTAGRIAGGRPGRVTGLDPAGPGWSKNPNSLNRMSGIYVESIHTDSGFLGIMDPISHADFYPNGGRSPQPGCWMIPCSHGRATVLFASSIRTNHFIGSECTNIYQAELNNCTGRKMYMGNAIMGKRGTGIFGLSTRDIWPF